MDPNKTATLGLLASLEAVIEAMRENLPKPYLLHLRFSARLGDVSMTAEVDLSEEVKEE